MSNKDLNKKKAVHQLGVFGFFAMTASMVMTVYEYPSFASSGFKLVFFLVVGGLLWFLPVSPASYCRAYSGPTAGRFCC